MNNVNVKYFSGYIRNFKSLCDELKIDSSLTREAREEEILKKAFLKWNTDMMNHLYGMFAIAIEADSKVYCIRDQVGQKQMFYAVINGEFVCSGDIDEIVSSEGFEKRLNKRMFQQYLFYGYPIGEETFYEGVYKLKPGYYAVFDGKKVELNRYFKL